MPPIAGTDPAAGCDNLVAWLSVKYRWYLTIDNHERTAINNTADSLNC